MCLNPLHIGNPSRRFTDGLSKVILSVPCGKCKDCVKSKEDEWFVRSFFEYKRVKVRGGQVYFVLLTYDEEHLPWYEDEETGFTFPCFSPEDIRNFRASVRVYLTRDGYDCTGENAVRFALYPEFGGETGRPHWHCLVYVPFELPLQYVIGKWSVVDGKKRLVGGLFQRAWVNGFVSWSKDKSTGRLRPYLESDKGVMYSQKYVNKEQKWLDKLGINDFYNYLKEQKKKSVVAGNLDYYKEKIRVFKRALPRQYTSDFFGADGIDYFKASDGSWDIPKLCNGQIDLTTCGKQPDPKHPGWTYNMPRYYKRKIMYTQDEYKLWQRNDIGFEVAAYRFWISKRNQENVYKNYFSFMKIKEHCPFLSVKESLEIFNSIRSIMNGRSVEDLVMYDKVFRGIPLAYDCLDGKPRPYSEREHLEGVNYEVEPCNIDMNRWVIDTIDLTPKQMLKYFHEHELDFYMETIHLDREPDPEHCARKNRAGFYKKRNGFEIFDCFRGFDDVLEIIEDLEKRLGEHEQKGYDINEERKRRIIALTGCGGWYEV